MRGPVRRVQARFQAGSGWRTIELAAAVLHGAHSNHTLLDPHAAASSHCQLRIGMLSRPNEQLEASVPELRALVRERMASGS